ncbi:MAG: hypothetical protein SPG40_10145 [Kiritimatiellia bacterium]|nr:hypothetical protein [Kiritimatiellia bacterium]
MKKVLGAALIAIFATVLHADTDGNFMLAIFSPGELPMPTSSIYGARLSLIYGECHEFYGLDLGVAGYARDSATGVQLDACWNGVGTDMAGLQAGLANTVEGHLYGLQVGLANAASTVYGCQIGLVNISDRLYGCQIGLANFTLERPWSFWPIINVGW